MTYCAFTPCSALPCGALPPVPLFLLPLLVPRRSAAPCGAALRRATFRRVTPCFATPRGLCRLVVWGPLGLVLALSPALTGVSGDGDGPVSILVCCCTFPGDLGCVSLRCSTLHHFPPRCASVAPCVFCAMRRCTMHCYATQCFATRFFATRFFFLAVLCHAVLRHAVLRCASPCGASLLCCVLQFCASMATLCYATPCFAMLCRAWPRYASPWCALSAIHFVALADDSFAMFVRCAVLHCAACALALLPRGFFLVLRYDLA